MFQIEAALQHNEKIILTLRSLYLKYGYRSYRMSKFEEYDFYARNKEFLVSDQVITFTDTTGKLMAMKPDVTLSIIRNHKDLPDQIQKVCYNENVYRVSKGTNEFKELMQTGLECFGDVSDKELCEVVELACASLRCLSSKGMINLSDLTVLEVLLKDMTSIESCQERLLKAVSEKNLHEIHQICMENQIDEEKENLLKKLVSIHGSISEAGKELNQLIGTGSESMDRSLEKFMALLQQLTDCAYTEMIQVDFSIVGDTNYYNGLIFQGFIEGIPGPVLSGGQYDKLMEKLQRISKAIGFAVYLDELERLEIQSGAEKNDDSASKLPMLNVALPKGRLGEKVYAMFAEAGFECPSILEPGRKLIFENPEKGVRYFWVKPSDVAIYVERGAADIGVAGKDILLEYEPDVYELLDLDIGKCRMAVAGPKNKSIDPDGTLRVATKFSNIAKKYYMSTGKDIDIIHLNGSIEIAPILGLSDVIVDIVETGTTLKENDLEVKETIVPISARLIANKSSYMFRTQQMKRIMEGLSKEKKA